MKSVARLAGALALAFALAGPVPSAFADDGKTDDGKMDDLDQRLKILERKQEVEQEKAAQKAKETPTVGTGKEGVSITSADGANTLRIRGYLQVDSVFFDDDRQNPGADSTFLRRARPVFEGTVGRIFDFKLMPDFGQGKTVLYDAYLDMRFHPGAKLRAGKFKPPVGLERLQSATDIAFVRRAQTEQLVPNRDVGLQLHGDFKDGLVAYQVMGSNGTPDNGNVDGDTNDGKEVSARVFAHPFRLAGSLTVHDLGIGIAGSYGHNRGNTTNTGLGVYKTPGDLTYFSYRTNSPATPAGTAIADGKRTRFSPQAYWYVGRVGLMAEYVESSQQVALGTTGDFLTNTAWQGLVTVLLTDDRSSYKGVSPKKPFDTKRRGGKGAVELALRHSRVDVDAKAFPIFADPARAARTADEWAAGVNWYLTRNVRVTLNYDVTRFEGGAAGGDRETEKVWLSRFQISF